MAMDLTSPECPIWTNISGPCLLIAGAGFSEAQAVTQPKIRIATAAGHSTEKKYLLGGPHIIPSPGILSAFLNQHALRRGAQLFAPFFQPVELQLPVFFHDASGDRHGLHVPKSAQSQSVSCLHPPAAAPF